MVAVASEKSESAMEKVEDDRDDATLLVILYVEDRAGISTSTMSSSRLELRFAGNLLIGDKSISLGLEDKVDEVSQADVKVALDVSCRFLPRAAPKLASIDIQPPLDESRVSEYDVNYRID